MLILSPLLLSIILMNEVMKVQAREYEDKQDKPHYCFDPTKANWLRNDELRRFLPLNCKPPTPECDYERNLCVSSSKRSLEMLMEPGEPVLNCVHPVFSHLLEKKEYRDSHLACEPPVPFCDFEKNLCVTTMNRKLRRGVRLIQKPTDNCVDPSIAEILKYEEFRTPEQMACKPPRPYCNYQINKCVSEPVKQDPLIHTDVKIHCVPPRFASAIKVFSLRKPLKKIMQCRPPTADCDFKSNTCVGTINHESRQGIKHVQKRADNCVDPTIAGMLKYEEYRTPEHIACKPPMPYCNYKINKCVEEPLKEEFLVDEGNVINCIPPKHAKALKLVCLRKYLKLNCRPPTPECDYENNECVEADLENEDEEKKEMNKKKRN